MTRTITTADLAPLVTRHGADFETSKWTVELGFPASEPVSIHSWQADLLAAIPSAPAPVVSDAAVEAAAFVLAERWGAPGAQDAYRPDAHAALSAALPFLGAAPSATREDDLLTEPHDGHEPSVTCPGCPHVPSATREDVEGAIYDVDAASGEAVLEPSEIAWLADGLLARFTITPRTDR